MSLPESPIQRDRRAQRDAFMGKAPMHGPQLPGRESKIRESPAQEARRKFKESFFEPRVMRKSSVEKVADAYTTNESPKVTQHPVTGGKTKNEARDSGGTVIFKDCEGTEILRITNAEGVDGEQEIRAGCEGSSSYPV